MQFQGLVTACQAFVGTADRGPPGLHDRQLGDDARTIVHESVVRASLDCIETAVNTSKVDVDSELAKLLQGEWAMPRVL